MAHFGRVGGLALVVLALLAVPANAREGELDPGFGSDGYVLTPNYFGQAGTLAVERNGDVLLVGSWRGDWRLMRIASDGSTMSVLHREVPASATEVAVQPDGRIVVAGTKLDYPDPPDDEWMEAGIAVWRYNRDGSPDDSFGDGGMAVVPGSTRLGPRGLDLAPDGRIVVGGTNVVAQLGPDGSVERTYSGPDDWNIDVVAATNDGSAIVGGSVYDPRGPNCCSPDDWLLGRLTQNLTPDPTFTAPFLGPGSSVSDLAVQRDGRLLVTGHGSDGNALAVRLTVAGGLDATFSNPFGATSGFPDAVALDQQQRILLSGPGLLARSNPDGSADDSFGLNGRTTEWPPDTWPDGPPVTHDVAVQPDGGVLVSFYGPVPPPPGDPTERQPGSLGVARFLRTDAAAAKIRCGGLPATIVGSADPDALKGTKRRDVIAGLGGDDRIRGLAGGDVVCGGPGDDRLRGGPGRDRLFGGAGTDLLDGGKGRDLLRGGKGRSRLRP
jgi:uncharacterized delta-60 repeat protein